MKSQHPTSNIEDPALVDRAAIASEMLGFAVECGSTFECPARQLHSKASGKQDARIYLRSGIPTISCFHSSCAGEIERLNHELRSRIGKAEWAAEHGGGRHQGNGHKGTEIAQAAPVLAQKARQEFNPAALERIFRPDWSTPLQLAEVSPTKVAKVTPGFFLQCLYPAEARILIFTRFTSQGDYLWTQDKFYRLAARPGVKASRVKALPERHAAGVWWLPQPVSGLWEPTATGKLTRRSQSNVLDWSWLVLEHDPAPGADVTRENALWLSFLAQLPLPVAAIYSSGGKSIHALVKLADVHSKAEWDACKRSFAPMLTAMGADPAALTAVRLTRLPGCWRGNRPQRLYYFNPRPSLEGVPIAEGGYRRFAALSNA